jgi:hypothetical protein
MTPSLQKETGHFYAEHVEGLEALKQTVLDKRGGGGTR